jgi:3-phenylpropionate/trans-cinnamate dioxygenase ferredoxin subunit
MSTCRVAKVDSLPRGERRLVTAEGLGSIAVFNVDGRYYAIRNVCPHRGGPLGCGRLRPHVVATDVYQIAFEREDEILKCPWHNWEFDLKTGRALYDQTARAKTYRVSVEDDWIVVHLD